MKNSSSRSWRTSDRELAQELISTGWEMVHQEMDGLTAYYFFEWSTGLADEIMMSKVLVNPDDDVDEFSTSDISLVAFLRLHGIMPLDTKMERRSVMWVFEDTDSTAELVGQFFGVVSEIDLQLYNESVANVRTFAISERDAAVRSAVNS